MSTTKNSPSTNIESGSFWDVLSKLPFPVAGMTLAGALTMAGHSAYRNVPKLVNIGVDQFSCAIDEGTEEGQTVRPRAIKLFVAIGHHLAEQNREEWRRLERARIQAQNQLDVSTRNLNLGNLDPVFVGAWEQRHAENQAALAKILEDQAKIDAEYAPNDVIEYSWPLEDICPSS